MANKAISELPQAQNVNNQDLFVLEQSGIAKKLTAETFITEQGIIDALAEALDGHGGIQSVTLSSVSGRIRTYRITFTDQSATTFQVYDGTSIDRISRTSSSGLDDVYTVFLSDGTTTFFTVHNGADGDVSEAMLNDALKDKAPVITETTESSAIATFTDGADDMPLHNILAEIKPVQDLTYGDPYPAGSGVNKFDGSAVTTTHSSNWGIDWNATTNVLTITQKTSYTTGTPAFSLNLPSGTYVVSYQNISETGKISLYTDGSWVKSLNNGVTFTLDSTKTNEIRFAAVTVTKFQLESGSTATAYSPYSNICPITGHTEVNVTRAGVNIWDEEWEVGGLSTSTGAAEIDNQKIRSKNFCACKPRTTYCKVCVNPATYVWYYDIEKNFISFATSATTFTTPDNCYYFKIRVGDLSHPQTTYNNDISINYPSMDTAYHAFVGSNSVSLSWQTEAGTVYDGTIDVATGLLTVTEVLYQAKWKDGISTTVLGNNTRKVFNSGFEANYPNYTRTPISNIAPYKAKYDEDSLHFYVNAINGYNTLVFLPNDTDGETDIQICYGLTTPQTYLLTPQQIMTLLGTNNVWADTGNVSVTYPADTKMYIENLTQPSEDDLIANQAITSGKYFMVGNSLYLALANIASGAQITIGTNAQRVSLADALNTINS